MTTEQYDDAARRIGEAGIEFPPDALDCHISFESEGNMRVSEIWDSREQFEAFGEKLMPIRSDAGIEFSDQPKIFEVHRVVKR